MKNLLHICLTTQEAKVLKSLGEKAAHALSIGATWSVDPLHILGTDGDGEPLCWWNLHWGEIEETRAALKRGEDPHDHFPVQDVKGLVAYLGGDKQARAIIAATLFGA